MMKRILLFSLSFFCFYSLLAQPKIKDKKYPSLLWEISGKGMKKSSYLIGTMHVSSKLAFHLPDSFYIALRNAEVVALETNPETWQEDMSNYDVSGNGAYDYNSDNYSSYKSIPNDYLTINTLKFFKYDTKIERALYNNPSTINNLLYRSYGNQASDFEEDTYLDMYIFQCGKKWGKKVTGVENYGESMKLMAEAYKDAAKDKSKKIRSYDESEDYSMDKLQEAYRNGNLDMLDSINKYNSTSAAFDEKFLYRRNEIQANSIDSILVSGSTLFVGVGAAHLPGERGVIEMLRSKGYTLRPVKMGERDSRYKDLVDKIRVPVVFKTITADDGLFNVDIPGKLYTQGQDNRFDDISMDLKQYADMSNGSYYMVTRIMTNAWMWSHSTDDVYKKVDSLLYENVPGKIISKTAITKNGFKGFDISNRTRRGDLQRYQIIITPFEIIFFKMSGTGDYVKNGAEANTFFNSIQFKEYKTGNGTSGSVWKKYSPPYGGFAVDLPHEPYIGNDGSWIYDAEDKATSTHYRIVRSDIHNYHFVEEDTFDLSLMNESFLASEFIDSQFLRKQTIHKGYAALDGAYKDKAGSVYLTRFIIQGPHYYSLITHGKKETPAMKNFLNSFELKPFVYKDPKQQTDTSLYFTVKTPVYPDDKKIKLDFPRFNLFASEEDEESEDDLLESGAYRSKIISNDTIGEKIYVSFYRSPRYYYTKDSTALDKEGESSFYTDSTWIIRLKKKTKLSNRMRVWESIATDSGSSRTLWSKTFYKDGIGFTLCSQSDTLSEPSAFVKNFFETFTPADTLTGINPFEKKSKLFFEDFMSNDSLLHKRAVKHIDDIDLDSTDLPNLKKAISWTNWKEKKYLDIKKSLIYKLSYISTTEASDFLKELYYSLDDTVQLQYATLEGLLQQKTAYAFSVFKEIINTDPPVLVSGELENDYSISSAVQVLRNIGKYHYNNGNFLDELSDTLKLTRTILTELLPLLNLDDYKSSIMKLLGKMVDSNLVKPEDYEMYYSKFLIEARQELKKQSVAEKIKSIQKAEESKEEKKKNSWYYEEEEKDEGNEDLSLYATLLLPFRETHAAVKPLIEQMLRSNDKELKYGTMLQLLQHNKPFPDSLLNYFGSLDDYRYKLYADLKRMKKPEKFPGLYNNHLDLGRSSLFYRKSYGKPDSLIYVDRLKTEYKSKNGFIYFYKYKEKKDDLVWKLAVAGLVPEDPGQFEFTDSVKKNVLDYYYERFPSYAYSRYDFTEFTDTKIEQDVPMLKQLNKKLKRLIYSRRKSAKNFYEDNGDRTMDRSYVD